MRNRILVMLIALAVIVGFAAARYSQAQAGPQGEAARTNQFAGGNDHTGAIPSVLPPEGWKPCPRCQNQKDRTDSAAKDKVCLLYTSPSPRDGLLSRMPSSA